MCQVKVTTTQEIGVRKFTWAEIEKSVPKQGNPATITNDPVYIVIHNKVYDLSGDFFSWHPGGGVAFSQLGKDATGAFEVFHRDATFEILANFYVGDLAEDQVKRSTGFAQDVQKLRALIQSSGWYQSSKIWYTRNVLQTLALCITGIALLAFYPQNIFSTLLSAILVGTFWQQCGWLAHDFLHHQVFQNRAYNDLIGYFLGNVCQGFSVAWWKHKHCTHHSVPNVHNGDPDIDTLPFLAWSEHALEGFADVSDATLAKFLVAYQPILYFPLLSFARLNWAINSIVWNIHDTRKSGKVFPTSKLIEIFTLAIHWAWYLGAAFYFLKPSYALLWIITSQASCGILLAAVFSVNHNGMPIYTPKEASDLNFYQLSILTGRDVHATTFNNWFTGGLNMQIEHHMFPSIPRHNLYKVVPHVKEICVKHGIEYHETGLMDGLWEVVSRLAVVSKAARKLKVQ